MLKYNSEKQDKSFCQSYELIYLRIHKCTKFKKAHHLGSINHIYFNFLLHAI